MPHMFSRVKSRALKALGMSGKVLGKGFLAHQQAADIVKKKNYKLATKATGRDMSSIGYKLF